MKKKIAFTWIYPLSDSGGGVERVTLGLMEGLTKRGYDCVFLLHDTKNNEFIHEGRIFSDLDLFLRLHSIDTLVNQNGYTSQITDALASGTWDGRYIVCHHNEPLFLRKIYSWRRVLAEVSSPGASRERRLAWMFRLLGYPLWKQYSARQIGKTQDRNYQRADKYVLLSPRFLPEFAKLVRRNTVPKVVAIPNPLSFEIEPTEALGYQKKNEVLIVARLNDGEKRISAALASWKQIECQDNDGWVLKIVGDGPDATSLSARAKQLGLRRVEFLGKQDSLSSFRTAAIFLMTSRVEGWGLTVTEAMQTATVPVAFDAYAALHDIIENGETGIVVPNGDTAALSEAVRGLMVDKERRESYAANGLVSCQRFRSDAVLNQWEKIL